MAWFIPIVTTSRVIKLFVKETDVNNGLPWEIICGPKIKKIMSEFWKSLYKLCGVQMHDVLECPKQCMWVHKRDLSFQKKSLREFQVGQKVFLIVTLNTQS